MPQETDPVQSIKDSAKEFSEVVLRHYGKQLAYDESSLRWIEEMIIDKIGQKLAGDAQRALMSMVGAFLGEALISNYGGGWKEDPKHGWVVHSLMGGDNWFLPFSKTEKRFKQMEGESIAGFFVLIPEVLRHNRGA